MSDRVKVVRLSKAAREFNIALDTVVDFLSEKGFDVIKNPNTKLDPEMYSILQKEFQDEKEVLKASKERNLEFLGQGPITIGGASTKEPKKQKEDTYVQDEIFITNHGVSKKAEKPVVEPVDEPEVIIEEEVVVEKPETVAVEEEVIEKEVIEVETKEEETKEEEIKEEKKIEEPTAKVEEPIIEEKTEVVEEPVVEVVKEEQPETIEEVVVEETKEESIESKDIESEKKM